SPGTDGLADPFAGRAYEGFLRRVDGTVAKRIACSIGWVAMAVVARGLSVSPALRDRCAVTKEPLPAGYFDAVRRASGLADKPNSSTPEGRGGLSALGGTARHGPEPRSRVRPLLRGLAQFRV